MLKTILSISGKPGLYKLVSRAKQMLIVESISTDKKRIPAHANEKIVSLGDIAIYTEDAEAPLRDIFVAMQKKEEGALASIDLKKVDAAKLRDYFTEILPSFDRDRVYVTDIKKIISWYNILVSNGVADFTVKEESVETPAE